MENIVRAVKEVLGNGPLIYEMTRREVVGRYRGSLFGLVWSLFNPLFMLSVYTFAFGVLFKTRWPGVGGGNAGYAIVLLSALLVFNFFSECANKAPGLIAQNTNYVKKVIFPLEILPVVLVCSALFHYFVGLFVWLVAYQIAIGVWKWSLLFLPLAMIPLVLFTLGVSWFLAAIGVYLRDVGQVVGVFTAALMFLVPVFYPVDSVPQSLKLMVDLNPLTHFVEMFRELMIYGRVPDFGYWCLMTFSAVGFSLGCLMWFRYVRRGFSDVI